MARRRRCSARDDLALLVLRQFGYVGGSADGHLALLDRSHQLGGATVEHFAGALHRSPTDVEHVGSVVLTNCANWRTFCGPVRRQRRDLRRDHGALALVAVAACLVVAYVTWLQQRGGPVDFGNACVYRRERMPWL